MRSQDSAKDLFSLSRAFARVWKTPEARRELGEGFFNLADKTGNLAERITELGPPASAVGDFGIAVAKGSPAVVAAGIVCPAWGLGLLAAVSAFSIYKVHRAWAEAKEDEMHQALTRAIAEDFAAIGQEIEAQGKALGLKENWTGKPEDLAKFMAAALKEATNDSDSRAVSYLRDLKQSNADMIDWFKDYVDRAEERSAPIFDELKEIRGDLAGIWQELGVINKEVRALTNRESIVLHMPEWTAEFVRERRGRFYGREEWLQENLAWIEQKEVPETRHWAVIAPAGTGKSSVLAEASSRAIAAGWTVARHFLRNEYSRGTSPDAAFIHLIGQLRRFRPRILSDDRHRLPADAIKDGLDNLLAAEALESAKMGPTLIVLDGLDEVDHKDGFLDAWTDALRKMEGPLVVLVGIRRDEEDAPMGWGRVWSPLPLPALSRSGVKEWLERAGDGELAAQAEALAGRVLEASEGLPLLIQYLLDDLLSSSAGSGKELGFGKGLEDYVNAAVYDLKTQEDEVLDILGLLAIARGPLRSREISSILEVRTERIAGKAEGRAARWWRRIDLGAGQDQERTYLFAHPRLGRAFAVAPELDTQGLRHRLYAWLMKNRDGYAFDWGVMHLAEPGGREEWVAEAAARATSLDYILRKFESGQESRLHKELRLIESTGGEK